MTGQEAVERIHQEAWTGRKPGLSRTLELLQKVGDPHRKLKFVHITGTNGKGSTAAMVASVLAQAGLRTGLYTSPTCGASMSASRSTASPSPTTPWAAWPSRCSRRARGWRTRPRSLS